jgi:hypothetical protein
VHAARSAPGELDFRGRLAGFSLPRQDSGPMMSAEVDQLHDDIEHRAPGS